MDPLPQVKPHDQQQPGDRQRADPIAPPPQPEPRIEVAKPTSQPNGSARSSHHKSQHHAPPPPLSSTSTGQLFAPLLAAPDAPDANAPIAGSTNNPLEQETGGDLFDAFLHRRAHSYIATVIRRLHVELAAHAHRALHTPYTLPNASPHHTEHAQKNGGHRHTRLAITLLLISPAVDYAVQYLNDKIARDRLQSDRITTANFYRFLAVLLSSQSSGLSIAKSLAVHKRNRHVAPPSSIFHFIHTHLLTPSALSSSSSPSPSSSSSSSPASPSPPMSRFEQVAFRMSKLLFFVPMHQFISLDAALFGRDLPANAVVDALFHFVLAARFRGRDEEQHPVVERLLGALLENLGPHLSHKGVIVTADHATHPFAQIITKSGFCSLLVMPEHMAATRPVGGTPFLGGCACTTRARGVSGGDSGGMQPQQWQSLQRLAWEGVAVVQAIKALVGNAFTAWQMVYSEQLMGMNWALRSLQYYRERLESVECFADFVHDMCDELADFADGLDPSERVGDSEGGVMPTVDATASGTVLTVAGATAGATAAAGVTTVTTATTAMGGTAENGMLGLGLTAPDTVETRKLIRLAGNRKRNRIPFFNSVEGKRLRLMVSDHTPLITHGSQWCALCGGMKKGWRGHKSSYQCQSCTVNLCVRVADGTATNCWSLWHSSDVIEPRVLQRPKGSVAGGSPRVGEDGEGAAETEEVADDLKVEDGKTKYLNSSL